MFSMTGKMIDGVELAVCGNFTFEPSPEVVHRVKLGALFGQPYQGDIEPSRHLQAFECGVTWSLVDKKPDRATAIVLTQ